MYIYEDFYRNFFEKKIRNFIFLYKLCVFRYVVLGVYIKKIIYSINKKINKEKIICERFYLNK